MSTIIFSSIYFGPCTKNQHPDKWKHLFTLEYDLDSKVNRKVSTYSRISSYFDNKQADIFCKTTVLANFNYCPLIKRVFRVLYKNGNLSFDKCLMKEAGIATHGSNVEYNLRTKNLVILAQIWTQTYSINSIALRAGILWGSVI